MDNEFFTTDPEEAIFEEDEVFLSDEDSDEEEEELGENYSDNDMAFFHQLKKIKKKSRQSASSLKFQIQDLCKCGIERHVARIIDLQYNLESIEVIHPKLLDLKRDLLKEFAEVI